MGDQWMLNDANVNIAVWFLKKSGNRQKDFKNPLSLLFHTCTLPESLSLFHTHTRTHTARAGISYTSRKCWYFRVLKALFCCFFVLFWRMASQNVVSGASIMIYSLSSWWSVWIRLDSDAAGGSRLSLKPSASHWKSAWVQWWPNWQDHR